MSTQTVPPAYAGINFPGEYSTWPKIVDPIDGKTYYQVPQVPGSYYDPTTNSVGTGVNMLPSQKIKAQKAAQDVVSPKPSTGSQISQGLLPIAGSVAGAYGIHEALAPPAAVAPAVTHTGGAIAPTLSNAGIIDSGATTPGISLIPGVDPATGLTLGAGETTAPATAGIVDAGSGAADAAGTSTLGSIGVPAAAAVATYLAGREALNMFHGKYDGSVQGKIGRVILGAATGGLDEVANRIFNGTKSQAQQSRDKTRSTLQGAGITDHDYNVTLADGSTYNIGNDGHAKLQNQGKNIDGGDTRHPYDVDFSNPLAVASIPQLQALAAQIKGPKATQTELEQTVGMLSNAVTSNAKTQDDVTRNIAAIQARQSGGTAPVVTAPVATPVAQPVATPATNIPALNGMLRTVAPVATTPIAQPVTHVVTPMIAAPAAKPVIIPNVPGAVLGTPGTGMLTKKNPFNVNFVGQ